MTDTEVLALADDLAGSLAAGDAAVLALRQALVEIRERGSKLAAVRPDAALTLSDFLSRVPVKLATALSVAGFQISGRSGFFTTDIDGWPDASEQSMAAVLPQDWLRKIAGPVTEASEAERRARDELAKANDARNAKVAFGRPETKEGK